MQGFATFVRRAALAAAYCLALNVSHPGLAAAPADQADYGDVTDADLVVKDFHFHSGQTLPELRLHYRTLGRPVVDAKGHVSNAILVLHGTSGSGTQFFNPAFASEMFGPGQPMDTGKYFVILPDAIGHGQSSKPSDGLHAHFPHYDYSDIVKAQHLIAEKLGADHLYMVLGTSMGGMNAWVWAETYPRASDYYIPLACLPAPITGRNLLWRRMVINVVHSDPGYEAGDYSVQPTGLAAVLPLFDLMTHSQSELRRTLSTPEKADASVQKIAKQSSKDDANDLAYAFDASRNYDPTADLGRIKGRLLTINFADDELNNGQLDLVDVALRQVPTARGVTVPEGPKSRGHGTHTIAVVWKRYLLDFLAQR